MGEGFTKIRGKDRTIRGQCHAYAASLTRRLQHDRQRELHLYLTCGRIEVVSTLDHYIFDKRYRVTGKDLFCGYLVHRHSAGEHAAPCVGNAHYLEQALHRSVFPTSAMQGKHGDVRFFSIEIYRKPARDIHFDHLVTELPQRGSDRAATLERDFTLGAHPAHQDSYFESHGFSSPSNPISLTSASRHIPKLSLTSRAATSISALMSRAVAPPSLTMKFA